MMEPYSLHLAGVLLTFLLKVTAAFLLCLVLAYLLPNPRHRFLAWLGLLLGTGLAWIDLFGGEAVSFISAIKGGAILDATLPNAGEHLTVPAHWGLWIGRITLSLGVIYLAGAVTMLVLEIHKHVRLRALLRQGRQPSPELRQVFQRICREFNVQRCRLLVLPRINSPATVYWWRPRVILPDFCESLVDTPELENVLRHELVHTLRCDYLWATITDVFCALVFFHPAVWHSRRRMILQRELSCDLAVVEAQPGHRADYADSLTHFMRLLMLQQQPSPGVEFAAPSSFLGTRIRCILTEPEEVPGWKRTAADVVFVTFVVVFGSMSPALSVSFAVSPEPPKSLQSAPMVHDPGASPLANHDQQPLDRSTMPPSHSRSGLPQSGPTPDGNKADDPEALNDDTDQSTALAVAEAAHRISRSGHHTPARGRK